MTTSSAANLDRFYVDHRPLDQIVRAFHATTMEWLKDLSDHRPMRLTKQKHTQDKYATIPTRHINRPEWASKLRWACVEKLHQLYHLGFPIYSSCNPLSHIQTKGKENLTLSTKLRVLKETMGEICNAMLEHYTRSPPTAPANPRNDEDYSLS